MFDQFQQMPTAMKAIMAGLCLTCLLAVAAMIDTRALVIVGIGILLVAVAILLWKLFLRWQAHRSARALSGQLAAHSSATPNAISDPARRAKLDDLRQNFSRGLEKFNAAGKDLYSLPWYVVCGEPGSGKTEAVRHCNVGFPPGLQDEMQGAGGTINMHWWFTNHAVLIDTAGKLLFQEAPPGSTTEWAEFLKLLKKARPNCPINGLLLVIPSESLIRDSFEDIQRKAGKIAQQLDTIQRTLDVRFPVFVLISKCDLINGFREFFSGVKDPQLQHQMTGWSNPASLDTPFHPDAVDQHLSEVVQRVSRRRLGLLRDPVPADAGKRRVDEVDALFTLPASIGALAPRLRKYLEMIFVAGEWSAKPLFLRGIYFTSALTEGAALDAELATALGIPVDKLPEGKAWERERSFFLRDLFIQKIFKEKGLVTRASSTDKLLRRRRQIIGGVVIAGLLILLGVSIVGRSALKSSVGGELAYWGPGVRAENWAGGSWRPIVNSGLEYSGNDVIRLEDNREFSVLEFHEKLQQLVSTDLHIPWVYKPVATFAERTNSGRRKAQQVLFEASVITPLVDANRDRLINATNWAPADSERLAALIQVEGAIHLKELSGYNREYLAEDFFVPLMGPSMTPVPNGADAINRLMKIYEWTYFGGGTGRNEWPGAWLSRGKTLRDNQPLLRGWAGLDRSIKESQSAQRDAIQSIQAGRLAVIRFREAEKAFFRAAAQPRPSSGGWAANVASAWNELAASRGVLDRLVVELKSKTGVSGEITLDGSYSATLGKVRAEAGRASARIRAVLAKQKAAAAVAAKAVNGPASEFTLYRDLERHLSALDAQIMAQLEQLLPAAEQAQLASLDADSLRALPNGTASYVARCDVYALVMQDLAPTQREGESLFGHLGERLGLQARSYAAARELAPKYEGPVRPEFSSTMAVLLDVAVAHGLEATVADYSREIERTFPATLGYPLGSGQPMSFAQFKAASSALGRVRVDAALNSLPAELNRALESRFARAAQLGAFASQLIAPDGSPVLVKVQLLRDKDQAATIELALGPAKAPRQALARIFPSMRLNGRSFRPRGLPENVEIDKVSAAAGLSRLEFFTTPDPKPIADLVIEPGASWGLLRLIQAGAVRRADGKEWDAVAHVNDRGTDLVLGLTLVFDQALPELDKWPVSTPK